MASVAESKQKFGSNFKIATVNGVILEIIVPHERARKETLLRIDWSIGSGKEEGVENLQHLACEG